MDIQVQRLTQTFSWQDAPAADFTVIAEDASHSLSPRMHNAAFSALGLPYQYVAINVPSGEVGLALDHLRALNYKGVNVTVPHKEEARAWCTDFVNPRYPEVNFANTILLSEQKGFNTDTTGFLCSLLSTPIPNPFPLHKKGHQLAQYIEQVSPLNPLRVDLPPFAQGEGASIPFTLGLKPGDRCLVLGAGGSSYACIAVLLRMGCEVFLWNRTPQRAEDARERFQNLLEVQEKPNLQGVNLLVNATSVGKLGGELPLDWSEAPPEMVAYDLYYAQKPTQFLQHAMDNGLRTLDGSNLLVYQGAEAWRCWGLPEAPVNLMVKEVQDALAG